MGLEKIQGHRTEQSTHCAMSHQVAKTNAETEEAKRKAEEEEWGHFGSWDFGILVILNHY